MLAAVTKYYNVPIGGRANKQDYVKALTKFKSKNATRVMQRAYRSIKSKLVNRDAAKKIQTIARGKNTRTKKILSALRRPAIKASKERTPPSAIYVPDLMADTHQINPMRVKDNVMVAAGIRGGVRSFNEDDRNNFALLQNATTARWRDSSIKHSSLNVLTKQQLYTGWVDGIKFLFASEMMLNPHFHDSQLSLKIKRFMYRPDPITRSLSHLLFEAVVTTVLQAMRNGNVISDKTPEEPGYLPWNSNGLKVAFSKVKQSEEVNYLATIARTGGEAQWDRGRGQNQIHIFNLIDSVYNLTEVFHKDIYWDLHDIQTYLKYSEHDPAKIQKVTYFGKKKKVTKTKTKVTKTKAKVTKTKTKVTKTKSKLPRR